MTEKKLIIISCDTNSYPSMNFDGTISSDEEFKEYLKQYGIEECSKTFEELTYLDAYKIQDLINETSGDIEYLVRLV